MATFSSVSPANRDNLKCSICLELFNDPRVLPCLHTYCLKCLQGLVSNKKSDLSCPQCRAKHKIPKGGVGSYLCDLSILSELETAKATTEIEQTKLCDFCITGEVAVSYCNECSEYLCECCKDMHKRGKRSSTHTVTLLEEAALFGSLHVIKQNPYCSQHPDYKLEIFCKTCNTLVCCKCMLETTHKEHKYDFLKKVKNELVEQIKLKTQRIKEKKAVIKTGLSFVERFEQQTCSQRDKLETEINAACNEYIKKVQARKEELLKQVESKFTKDSKIIWATKDHLEVLLSQVESCEEFSEQYQIQGSKGQTLSLMKLLFHRLTELDCTDVDLSEIFTSFTQLTKFKKTSLSSLAKIGELTVDRKDVFTQGKLHNSKVNIDEKSTLVYILNEPLAQLVKWDCKYYRNNKLVSTCPVVVAGDNQLEVEFTPKQSGKYNFQLIPAGSSTVGVQKFAVNVPRKYIPLWDDESDDEDWIFKEPEKATNPNVRESSRSAIATSFSPAFAIPRYQSAVTANSSPAVTRSSGQATASPFSYKSYYKPALTIGTQVKRGPDWVYGDEDGGAGNVGLIVGTCDFLSEYDVKVKWNVTGYQYEYCWGSFGRYDLEIVH